MVPITSLWLPILLSAMVVFVASSILHMVLPYHRSDYRKLPDEALSGLGNLGLAPGDYMFPKPDGPRAMKDAAFLERWRRGPVGMMTIMKHGAAPSMGRPLALWFLFCLVTSVFAAYIAGAGAAARLRLRLHIPVRGCHGVRQLRSRDLADDDLVRPRLDHDPEVERGRPHLRPPDRRGLRLALAEIGKNASRPTESASRDHGRR